jgi:hypothetical protein
MYRVIKNLSGGFRRRPNVVQTLLTTAITYFMYRILVYSSLAFQAVTGKTARRQDDG